MFSYKFIASVFIAVSYASAALAAPWPANSKLTAYLQQHATHRVRNISRDLKLETYHPASVYETYEDGIDHPLSKRADASFQDSALAFVKSKAKLDDGAVAFRSGFEGDITSHAYFHQQHDGVPFANAVANVALKNNKVVAFGSSFVALPKDIPASKPTLDLQTAIKKAEAALSGTYNGHPTTVEYLAKDDGSVALTHVIQIQNDQGAWYEAFVDAHSGDLLSVTDFVTKLTYKVLPITKQDLTEGVETLEDPENKDASPNGWVKGKTTAGNNVIVYKSSASQRTSESDTDEFIYTHDASKAPTTSANLNAARTNAFYVVNTVHDISYTYGFTEKAYNFQDDNFGNGGEDGDRVTVSVQDSAGTDTPADGQSGHMRMFLWDETSPERDGALENDIVAHEMTHGISNRLTGGGTGRCLQTTEAGGMGEGWSDAFAEWTEQKSSKISDFTMGTYVINDKAYALAFAQPWGGIRTHPYSTSKTTNPLTYASIATLNEVHDIGEVWANMLHNVYASLVDENGFSEDAHTDASGSEGNVVFLHLFIDSLALQPCNPTLPTARDAWIQADKNRYDGAHTCTLWKAFASRGLGQNAKNHKDDDTVPSSC
ncbi:metalloprotease [Punctularia strigosozonata HHB-11173 SS5]|uniref:metalloprotease n=1 Tax=Punctularia strigosozonata (strain HHB-11173) TaxID=741275 RepID=UPI0004417BD6|nr:metalloprotease [Punctularia strigosozonata HHB-11173 SS5]EIN12650.1 metalloprotease [Punctularia strigosozonata HHB-11173 SS5]